MQPVSRISLLVSTDPLEKSHMQKSPSCKLVVVMPHVVVF